MPRLSLAWIPLALCLLAAPSWSKAKLPVVNDLPVPYNLQAVVLQKAVTLHWNWQGREENAAYESFGFEILKDGKQLAVVSGTTYTDTDVAWGTHTYRVRVSGIVKRKSQRVHHVSDFSEPAHITMKVTCTGVPSVSLDVQPTKRSYSNIPSLRLRLVGDVTVPAGCSVLQATYHIDNGMGMPRTGPLTLDSKGHFDEAVDAIGPDEEVPSGSATFTITTTAEDEAGPVTSNAYTITIELQNRFAPGAPD